MTQGIWNELIHFPKNKNPPIKQLTPKTYSEIPKPHHTKKSQARQSNSIGGYQPLEESVCNLSADRTETLKDSVFS